MLLELDAFGGQDRVRELSNRLVRYFPQLELGAPLLLQPPSRKRWQSLIRRAGKTLLARGEIERDGPLWRVTPLGRRRISLEQLTLSREEPTALKPDHRQLQRMLQAIGERLGYHAELEFEFYDVVWRRHALAPRLSHVFEVQVAGSLDSALTRLRQGYEAQRSLPFLVVADEKAALGAARRLEVAFHELAPVLRLIGAAELQALHASLEQHSDLLHRLLFQG